MKNARLKELLKEWEACDSISLKKSLEGEIVRITVSLMREIDEVYKKYTNHKYFCSSDTRNDHLKEFSRYDGERITISSPVFGPYSEGPSYFDVEVDGLFIDKEELAAKLKTDAIARCYEKIKEAENSLVFYKDRLAKLQQNT